VFAGSDHGVERSQQLGLALRQAPGLRQRAGLQQLGRGMSRLRWVKRRKSWSALVAVHCYFDNSFLGL